LAASQGGHCPYTAPGPGPQHSCNVSLVSEHIEMHPRNF